MATINPTPHATMATAAPHTQTPETSDPSTDSENSLFEALESYPWSSDPAFQSGLAAIIGDASAESPARVMELTLRARCFYYARKYQTRPIDPAAYGHWRATRAASSFPEPNITDPANTHTLHESSQATTNGSMPGSGENLFGRKQDKPPTFDEIMRLIESGQPIPGVKDIPNTVLLGQGTEASAAKRRKPWENRNSQQEQPEGNISIFSSAESLAPIMARGAQG